VICDGRPLKAVIDIVRYVLEGDGGAHAGVLRKQVGAEMVSSQTNIANPITPTSITPP
jgi:hypothetical protein